MAGDHGSGGSPGGVARAATRALSEGGPLLLASRTAGRGALSLQRIADFLAVRAAAATVKRANPESVEEAIDFAYAFDLGGIGIQPMQVAAELRAFLDFLAPERPARVLEIGTGRGGMLFLLGRVADERALLVTVDVVEGEPSFGGKRAYRHRAHLYTSLGSAEQKVVYLGRDSHAPETRACVTKILDGAQLDLLFIDGDHTYEGVREDFAMYSPLVRPGGCVAFHDIVPGPPAAVGGVPAFWHEVRDASAVEFVEDWDQGGYGIGVLHM